MRPSFIIMLAIGLALMALFWWKSWQVEADRAAEAALVLGCADGTASCPTDLPKCMTAFDVTAGVCSTPCTASSQCPEAWCCPIPPAGEAERLCVPRQTCLRLGER